MTLLAYTKTINKKEFVKELKAHQKADAFITGTYGKYEEGKFKGCAVGCSLQSVKTLKHIELSTSLHANYETHLGIPEWLAKLEDILFESLDVGRRKKWPVEFGTAINQGADLSLAKTPFIITILKMNLKSMNACKFDAIKFPEVAAALEGSKKAVKLMITAQTKYDSNLILAAAWSAAAWSAAAWSAAAWSAAAWSAAAWSAAKNKAYGKIADELLKILKSIKPMKGNK